MTPLLNSASKPLFVLRRISDKFVINPRAISNTTGAPNPGPDQEYLPIMTEPAPDHDPVFTVRTTVETTNEATLQQEIKYVVADRPKAEVLAYADNVRRMEVFKHVPQQDFTESVTILFGAVFRQLGSLELTEAEQAAKERVIVMAGKLTENIAAFADKKAAINLGQKPDFAAGLAEVAP